MSAVMSRLSELMVVVAGPIWNYPERMDEISRWLVRIFALIVLVAALLWVSQQPVFILRHIQIESAGDKELQHLQLATVRSQVLDKVQGNFFSVRLQDVKEAFEALPWVRQASVRRAWPNGLVVSIEEQKPFAIWGRSEQQKLMNVHGEVFAGSSSELDDATSLIEVSGPDGSSKEVLRLYQKANAWFKPWDAEVKTLVLSDRYAWHIKLSNGVRIEFGRDEEQAKGLLDQRVAQLIQYWPQVQQKWPSRVDTVDLRYSNGFAVRVVGAPVKTTSPSIKVENHTEQLVAFLNQDDQRSEELK